MDCQELKEIAEAKGKTVAQVRSIYSIPPLLSAFLDLAALDGLGEILVNRYA